MRRRDQSLLTVTASLTKQKKNYKNTKNICWILIDDKLIKHNNNFKSFSNADGI